MSDFLRHVSQGDPVAADLTQQLNRPNNEARLLLRRLELLLNLALNPLLIALRCVYQAVYVLVHALFPSQAIRNRVKTGMSGRRCSIDMVSSEYANFAPQSQHTR